MTKKRQPAPQTNHKFARAYHRHDLTNVVINSGSWDELFSKLQSDDLTLLFHEFKLFNLAIQTQHILAEFLGLLYGKGEMRKEDKVYEMIVCSTKRNRAVERHEAEEMIRSQTGKDRNRVYAPNVLLYIAGLSFGRLIHILRDHTNTFENKEAILCKLTSLNAARNMVVHTLLSSREDAQAGIETGIKEGQNALRMLQELLREYDEHCPG